MDTAGTLLVAAVLFLTFVFKRWYQDPIRQIPGPAGLPIIGNIVSLNAERMHTQFYDMAQKFGPIFKVHILNTPVVVLNTTELAVEALIKRGTDFHGRPPVPRLSKIFPLDVAFLSINDVHQPLLRRMFTKALKAYGPGVEHLEQIMQETISDVVTVIQEKGGEAIDTLELSNGYVCCVLASMMFGEKHSFNDAVCKDLHRLNNNIIEILDPYNIGALLDMFPVLFNCKLILRSTHDHLQKTEIEGNKYFQDRIDKARECFNRQQKRGCLDQLLEIQEEDKQSNLPLSDVMLRGMLMNFIVAGMETSSRSIVQALLDLLHEPLLIKRLQEQIDKNFDRDHKITLRDKEQLPLLEAFIYESMRQLAMAPFMLPHYTIRDTQVAGYRIPAETRVLINNYHTSHNPDVYEDPFTFKLERFLDEEGKIIAHDHPARSNLLTFGAGRRQCPGESFAKSRIFLFLTNILQRFDLKSVGKLPGRDGRDYKMGMLLTPVPARVSFIPRQHEIEVN